MINDENNNIFKMIIGSNVEAMSTVDHPYTSPPSHLFDAHSYLMEKYGDNISILNWDASLPGERTYRYDLITDTGLIAKLPLLYHYDTENFYCLQSFNQAPLSNLIHCVNLSLKTLRIKHSLSNIKIDSMLNYCQQIITLSKQSYNPTPWIYTKNLLINYYRFVDRNDMAIFIKKKYCNYWLSKIMTNWIPWCINNIDGELSIDNLIKNGIIIRTPFRFNFKVNKNLNPNDKDNLTKLISKGDIIPSFDIFLWSLFVAGIKHYGNDQGFFSRLATYLHNDKINDYQITIPGKDAIKILTLDKDYGVLLEINENEEIIESRMHYQHSKSSRINSLFAAIVFGGEEIIEYLKNYRRGQNEKIIKL